MNGYHPAIIELLRAAEAGELSRHDLEAIENAAANRHDVRATVQGIADFAGVVDQPPAQGFFRVLRKVIA